MSFLRESSAVLFYRVALVVAAFAADVIIARTFGPAGKGYIAIMVLTPVMFAVLATGGLEYALNYFGHRAPEQVHRFFTTSVLLGLAFAGAVCAVLYGDVGGLRTLLYSGVPEVHDAAVAVSVGIVPVEVAFQLAAMLAMTVGLPVLFGKMRLVRRSAVLVAVILAVFLFAGEAEAGIRVIILGQLGAIAAATLFCIHRSGFRWARPSRKVGALLRYGAVSLPGRVAERLQTRIDVILLGILGSGAAVGVYTVATGIAEMLFFVSSSTGTVLFSRSAADHGQLHEQVMRLMIPIAIGIAALTGAAGTLLIPWIYGAAFRDSVALLLILLPGAVCLSLVHTITPYVVQSGSARAVSLGQGAGLVSNVALNLALIPRLGAVGVAIASSISYALTIVVIMVHVVRAESRPLADFVLVRRTDLQRVRGVITDRIAMLAEARAGRRDGP